MNTIMSGGNMKQSAATADIKKYALFMGGTNVINEVLKQYDPLKTGYVRLFMVRGPLFIEHSMKADFDIFKHIVEYGNTSVQGMSGVSVNFNDMGGGYTNKRFQIPSYAQDSTESFTVKVYEFSGSPVRKVVHSWINGTSDLLTGLATYNGDSTPVSQANQTAEFIYVATDNTGKNVEYACMFANCFPKGINTDVFSYNSGEHNLVETDIEFTCTKYESIQINKVACALINKYKLLANSLNFYSGISVNDINKETGWGYNVTNGQLDPAMVNTNTEIPGGVKGNSLL